jgi:hypothetical protein
MNIRKIYNILSIFLIIMLIPNISASDSIPGFPHAFYGDVLVNGEPAVDGYEVSAIVENGTTINNIQNPILTYDGSYGLHDGKYLLVQGEDLSGAVHFYVNGVLADQTHLFEYDGGPTELDLSVTIEDTNEGSGDNTGGSGSSNNDSDSGSTSTPPADEENGEEPEELDIEEINSVLNSVDLDTDFGVNTNSDDLQVTLEDEISATVDLDSSNIDQITSKIDPSLQPELDAISSSVLNTAQKNNVTISSTIKTYKIEDNSGNEVYRTKIELKLQASDDIENVVYIQEIPKEVAIDISELIFNTPPSEVLLADPIVKWEFDSMALGEVKDLSYFVKKQLDTIPTLISVLGADDVSEEVVEDVDEDLNTEPINDINEEQEPTKSFTWLYILLLVVIIVLLIIILIKKPKQKSKGLKRY